VLSVSVIIEATYEAHWSIILIALHPASDLDQTKHTPREPEWSSFFDWRVDQLTKHACRSAGCCFDNVTALKKANREMYLFLV
jgi:hypothetical protein